MVTIHKITCLLVPSKITCPLVPLGAIYLNKPLNVFILNVGETFEFPTKEIKKQNKTKAPLQEHEGMTSKRAQIQNPVKSPRTQNSYMSKEGRMGRAGGA